MSGQTQELLTVENVSKRFRLEAGRELDVLRAVHFSVYEGEIVALLGPSGCGKTTLLKIMAGLIRPSEGCIKVKGKPLEGVNRNLAMVFQSPSLLPWYTVQQNVALGVRHLGLRRKKRNNRVNDSIELTGLGGFEEAYPRELSGGLRQRVGLARALAMRPEILSLDEPFSALDALTAEDLRAEVVSLWGDEDTLLRTVVMVTHDIYEAVFMAQKIYIFGESPGHIRTVIHNTLPYPRDIRHPKYQELVDKIHAVITEALIPEEEVESQTSAQPSWYRGLENLPAVGPNEIVGLLEVLGNSGGEIDIFELANETESEFGHCLAVVKTAELLDLVDTPKQKVMLAPLGKQFLEVDTPEGKELFSAQVGRLRIFQVLLTWIQESPEHEISREETLTRLQSYFPNEKLERLFDTLISFGRYAELLSYNAKLAVLTLPDPEEEEPDEETGEEEEDSEEGDNDLNPSV